MSPTGHERPGQPEQPEQQGPAQDAPPAGAADLGHDRLPRSADQAQDAPRRSDPRDLLADGVVELRKRGEPAARRAGAGPEDHLETVALRAAERVAAEGRPRA